MNFGGLWEYPKNLGISIQHFRLENFGGNDFPRPSGADLGRSGQISASNLVLRIRCLAPFFLVAGKQIN